MSVNLRVSPDEVRRAGQQFLNAATDLDGQLREVKSQVASLDPQWQDDAARKFKAAMVGHEAKLQKAILTFRETGNKLIQAANTYVQMEQAAAAKIRA